MKKLSLMLVFSWVLVLMFGSWAVSAHAQEYRYRYVSLNSVDLELPPGYTDFFPSSIHDSGRIYGGVIDESGFAYIGVYEDGGVTVLYPEVPIFFFGAQVNAGGTVGDAVLDPATFIAQAALFHPKKIELIPPQPGEVASTVWKHTDNGMALVVSFDENFVDTVLFYRNGEVTPLDFGVPYQPFDFFYLDINNKGIISGRTNIEGLGARGFRFNTRTGETTLLDPIPPDQHTWALGINTRGDILGYSFDFGGTERIGVWNRKGEFKTYFVEGTPEFPTISNDLLFNDNNLIVITLATGGNSYLVPKPGVRLNLADLVENLPPGTRLIQISDINNHGDMFGFGNPIGLFLLERIGAGVGD